MALKSKGNKPEKKVRGPKAYKPGMKDDKPEAKVAKAKEFIVQVPSRWNPPRPTREHRLHLRIGAPTALLRRQAHIIEVRDIKPIPGTVPDLVVTATVTRQGTKYTQVVRQTTSCAFDSFFEWRFLMTYDIFQDAKLQFRVLNANTELREEMLGMYDISMAQIRRQPMSEYFMVWLGLYSNPNEHTSELAGALRVSMTCLAGGQEEPKHSEDEIVDARDDENPLVLMPPLLRWTNCSLFVAVYRVEGLPQMDEYGVRLARLRPMRRLKSAQA
jgi:hypothetical protein